MKAATDLQGRLLLPIASIASAGLGAAIDFKQFPKLTMALLIAFGALAWCYLLIPRHSNEWTSSDANDFEGLRMMINTLRSVTVAALLAAPVTIMTVELVTPALPSEISELLAHIPLEAQGVYQVKVENNQAQIVNTATPIKLYMVAQHDASSYGNWEFVQIDSHGIYLVETVRALQVLCDEYMHRWVLTLGMFCLIAIGLFVGSIYFAETVGNVARLARITKAD